MYFFSFNIGDTNTKDIKFLVYIKNIHNQTVLSMHIVEQTF
jgi:hypothetical protein